MGDYRRALDYHKRYAILRDSAINAEKERNFSVLDLRYRLLEEKEKSQARKIQIMQKNKELIVVVFLAVIFAGSTLYVYLLHRKTKRLYRRIVKDKLAALEREKKLRMDIENMMAEKQVGTSHSAMGGKKAEDLFCRLEYALRHDRIYRDQGLSLDKTAAILKTNRTYLSQVVNEKAGTSFSNYVNEFRLIEAMEILSDSSDERVLKSVGYDVGFSTTSNFYSLFKQKVGMTPMKFRQNAKMK